MLSSVYPENLRAAVADAEARCEAVEALLTVRAPRQTAAVHAARLMEAERARAVLWGLLADWEAGEVTYEK